MKTKNTQKEYIKKEEKSSKKRTERIKNIRIKNIFDEFFNMPTLIEEFKEITIKHIKEKNKKLGITDKEILQKVLETKDEKKTNKKIKHILRFEILKQKGWKDKDLELFRKFLDLSIPNKEFKLYPWITIKPPISKYIESLIYDIACGPGFLRSQYNGLQEDVEQLVFISKNKMKIPPILEFSKMRKEKNRKRIEALKKPFHGSFRWEKKSFHHFS